MSGIYEQLLEAISNMKLADTHEHLPPSDHNLSPTGDILSIYFTAYLYEDLISAGLAREDAQCALDARFPLMRRWETIEPYWRLMRNTAYAREANLTVSLLYGIDGFHTDTLEELNDRFLQSRHPGRYEEILHGKCRIERCLLDSDLDADPRYFRSTVRMDRFIYPRNLEMFRDIERVTGMRVCSFDDWLEACDRYFDWAIRKGAVALKSNLAYERSLYYERASYHEAENEFRDLLVPLRYPVWDNEYIRTGKKLQDYMMHHILGLAQRKGLPFQFHTGLQAGNGNMMADADPELLCNLFLEYPDVKFCVMHIGYPHYLKLAALAKCFPNVYIDMCWAHIISPNACVNALGEYLDVTPMNKIFAFGGDHHHIDAVAGHVHMMRRNVAQALAAKVEHGDFGRDDALEIAHRILYQNPMDVYHLEKREG